MKKFTTVRITRKLSWDDVRQVCIHNQYYTRGTNEEYMDLFNIIRSFSTVDDTQLFQSVSLHVTNPPMKRF